MRYSYPPILNPVINLEKPIKEWSFTRLLLLVGTPLVAAVMLIMTVSTYRIASHYLNRAYARNAHTRALAQAHEIQQLLVEARYEVLNLGHADLTVESIQAYMMGKPATKRNRYAEIAFHAVDPDKNFLLLNTGEHLWRVPNDKASEIKFGTFTRKEKVEGKLEDFVQIEPPVQVYYTSIPYLGSVENMEFSVIRLSTPVMDRDKTFMGYLTLSVDIVEIQRVMTLFSSRQSPLYIFPQERERARSFFFDAAGWLICETGPAATGRAHISIDAIRTGLQGDMGRPGFDSAFRPNPQYEKYWAAVSAVQSGKDGEIDFSNFLNDPANTAKDHFLYYVPIRFQEEAGRDPAILGGIGCVDSSFMLKSSRYEIALALTISWLGALLLTLGAFFYLNRRISKPLNILTVAAEKLALGDETSTLDLSPLPKELRHLQHAMNVLLLQLQAARNETTLRQNKVFDEMQRQPVCLDSMVDALRTEKYQDNGVTSGIVGASHAMRELNAMIHKASQVMADVLIIGETGTGKELTAEAIHRGSARASGPFISINCGALDENLLMDALFGHVKGAFSEAKTDRKGAFLAASGGTLHLDEIGNASPKVQQAMLRALAARVIRPLGSDQEQPFDARVISATNVDLLECSQSGTFREDLYYRLAVITITTPPLRDRKEDIPALVRTFLADEAQGTGKNPPDLSRGALDKLLQYDWPGNIRELKNCITRAMTFAEGQILLADHLAFGQTKSLSRDTELAPVIPIQKGASAPACSDVAAETETQPSGMHRDRSRQTKTQLRSTASDDLRGLDLNHRQKKAWPSIVASGGTNRALYQSALGEEISVRTAQYDLQDMVNKGLLIKSGKGPSSRYVVAALSNLHQRE
ncbi:MAG: sigma 54-interacting transcriptional regulator [Desulfomicrobium sp.]|nr:sigma 54-interacting transcriptional regulator [Pseudomonadota bacterium]MBV1711489.1 sigma 54-interacting transcriptional regulator [Desulfomicrobium sp.]MBU4570892.1 sigma 54-interacting transcriptional regulator [Pseudomonadota bacterium]MBU4595382.1 sigma 54-interacting transcriptional regulator [Pseudomonadota bacterium]MBV1720813.1 sigma 54-interacting transcriptional regulator [Desulfomicrobium sp.]